MQDRPAKDTHQEGISARGNAWDEIEGGECFLRTISILKSQEIGQRGKGGILGPGEKLKKTGIQILISP